MAAISGGKTYHHGDLRNALICAAVDLATDGGPERVVLREAARRVGVSPTAAYRHFEGRGELLRTVKLHAQRLLADSMERAAAREPGADDPALAAERRLVALCRGYVGFAVEQPGLYRSAFCVPCLAEVEDRLSGRRSPEPEIRAFTLLKEALEVLSRVGGHRPDGSRPGCRLTAGAATWSAVHGLSLLLLDGPLRRLPAQRRNDVVESTLAMVVSGTRVL
ncbi:TetR/AcrR family transcriptional regulator [Streptomyces sp. NPDC006482]|uniref:TetR/AcrR family transcriptional regulator n=1 Tax=unclassified Streptomyces TaxID=2593676 RepID=UPI0022543300|nr:TetR/AcrR family transcriptional regulator [Streptomyces sp. NBC_00094]MCX5394300.1 TetR/AcrR family transcriptional regulator [Streptomyces sp. NBC_00094]